MKKFQTLKFRYCEKATKYEKKSHLFLKLLRQNKVGDLKKFLLPSHNINFKNVFVALSFITSYFYVPFIMLSML